ncbi:MAG TPA: DUF4242 domain-containing protein [Chitinophagaceae bacterium]
MLLTIVVLIATACKEKEKAKTVQASTLSVMPMFVIEREVPGAGKMDQQQLKELSQKSCDILRQMGSDIEWDHSYVTEDKIYCVYRAKDSSLIRKHALMGHFPANKITLAGTIISPKTAEMEIKE